MDTDSFSIYVSAETLEKTKHGSIVGYIWLQIEDNYYPSKAWYDFPVVILGWWLEKLASLCTGSVEVCRFQFMDGPYSFELAAGPLGEWVLRFLKHRATTTEVLFEGICDRKSVIHGMLAAADLVVRTCHDKQWASNDLTTLESSRDRLSKISNGFLS